MYILIMYEDIWNNFGHIIVFPSERKITSVTSLLKMQKKNVHAFQLNHWKFCQFISF
jgi:hypothetical protein